MIPTPSASTPSPSTPLPLIPSSLATTTTTAVGKMKSGTNAITRKYLEHDPEVSTELSAMDDIYDAVNQTTEK